MGGPCPLTPGTLAHPRKRTPPVQNLKGGYRFGTEGCSICKCGRFGWICSGGWLDIFLPPHPPGEKRHSAARPIGGARLVCQLAYKWRPTDLQWTPKSAQGLPKWSPSGDKGGWSRRDGEEQPGVKGGSGVAGAAPSPPSKKQTPITQGPNKKSKSWPLPLASPSLPDAPSKDFL